MAECKSCGRLVNIEDLEDGIGPCCFTHNYGVNDEQEAGIEDSDKEGA